MKKNEKNEIVEGQIDIYDILYPECKPKKIRKRTTEKHNDRLEQSPVRTDRKQNDEKRIKRR